MQFRICGIDVINHLVVLSFIDADVFLLSEFGPTK